ncbi:hypothetical protein [Streptomyces sp. TLI_146]|uniref:hypothetical protein n=1 Tax=Streptomyces sp. TLI_146 TaxID=1938858 RepID=UPI000C70C0AF|nr:hypothetical protein [Streptomyces sp. TLI_146]PKV82688.1 hypothetical protein BX283_0133 [Streptomyces sp. TLI_146]
MYVMRVLTSADTQAATALVRERIGALDAERAGRDAGAVTLRIAGSLGMRPSPSGCVAGLFDDGDLLAVLVLARHGSPDERALDVVDAYTHTSMRALRLGVLLSMWVSDHATRLTPPASRVTTVVHDPRLAAYLIEMCAWEQERHVRDAGRHAVFLHRPAEQLCNLDVLIGTEAVLVDALSEAGPAGGIEPRLSGISCSASEGRR